MIYNVLEIMQKAGYVGAYELVENGRGGVYEVTLRGAINRCGTVKPRHSVRRQDYEQWESRYLPAQDFGLLILSTSSGVMNHYDAKDARIGGKLLAYVY